MFTAKNAVLLALTQVGVIVMGTLAAAVSSKIWNNFGLELPFATFFLLNFGVLLCVFPLAWISAAMTIRQRVWISDDAKQLAFMTGMALLLTLIVFEIYAVFSPWISVCQLGFGSTPEIE